MSLFTGAIASGLIAAAVTGGAKVAASAIESHAAGKASDAQTKAAQEALDFTKAQKAKQEAAYAPFGALGQQAVGVLPGIARQAPTMGAPAPYTTQPAATRPMPTGMPQGAPLSAVGQTSMPMPMAAPMPPQGQPAGPGMPPGGSMVTLQSPDGHVKQFTPEEAQRILQIRDAQGRSARRLS